MKRDLRTERLLLSVALLLVLLGGVLAAWTQTCGGTVRVQDVRFTGANGTPMSALLFVPAGVTSRKPAPAVLAIHGYINSRETQSGFAIEFARRGYVVLALDQTGHGYSAPPAFASGFGGPDGLRYLRSLDIVDPDNIGLEGHSMGGWACLMAAQAVPDGYRAVVLEGSSTGTYGTKPGSADFPRNMAVVFSKYDEFSGLMWGAPIPRDIVGTPKLRAAFGVTEPVQVGRLYGSVENGTARRLYMPAVTHPQDHISKEAIGNALDWFQLTLRGGNPLPPANQIWRWKEAGTFLAFAGMVLAIFPLGALLLRTNYFKELAEAAPEPSGIRGVGWWAAALLGAGVPAATFFGAQHAANRLVRASAFWPQNITIGIAGWALFNGAVTLLLVSVRQWIVRRKSSTARADCGAGRPGCGLTARRIFRSLVLAATIVFAAHLMLSISDWAFKTDFRLWVLALKPMSFAQFRIFLSFLPPFLVYFLILGVSLHGQLRRGLPPAREMGANVLITVAGIIVLLLYQYVPLLMGGTLADPSEPLLTIVAFQFVPVLAFAALASTWFYRKTGRVYTGAFLNALLVTWYIVAGQATHVAP